MIKKKIKNGKKAPEPQVAVGISHGDVNSFLEKFKADVAEKTKKYREFAQESQNEKGEKPFNRKYSK